MTIRTTIMNDNYLFSVFFIYSTFYYIAYAFTAGEKEMKDYLFLSAVTLLFIKNEFFFF